jgi:hypothetical protein
MTRRSAVLGAALAAVAVGAGCKDGFRGGELAAPPSLSFSGASGVVADLRRTVTEGEGSSARVVSVLDTTVWAPFDENGAALPQAPDVGAPGPVGWTSKEAFDAPGWTRSGSFVDSAGVLHELLVVADNEGPGTSVEYRKGGRLALRYRAGWKAVSGGWALSAESFTFMPPDAPVLRVDVTARQMNIAGAAPAADVLRAGASLAGLLRPQPLAAQGLYFSACSTEWLVWGGTALLAEVAWSRFLRTRLPWDFKKATAATGTAGVALSKLVDCMVSQPEKPNLDP